ncbi:MAG: ATP-dependent DNA helicase, partial [Thermoplasmata archaeon]|nr:ATP-dependent DNA helicase [Thermoplasmata archaeon]
ALNLAENESYDHKDQEVLDGMKTSAFCRLVSNIIKRIKEDHLKDEDALIPRTALEEELLVEMGTSKKLKHLTKNLLLYGQLIKDSKQKRGRLPRSHIHHLGAFLEYWCGSDDEVYVKLISDRENPTLELYCLDPRDATSVIRNCHASVHMSGTLHPLEEYRDSTGLPKESPLRRYPSPFPPENKEILYLDDVTTKFEEFKEPENLSRMRGWIKRISTVGKNTAFFFPSYEVMSEFLDLRKEMGKRLFVESRGIGQAELISTIKRFKSSRNSLLFGVFGGRLSEGIDFPDEELELVVIVGIPYSKPTAKQRALVTYYDLTFKKGWEYAVRAPTLRKLHQAIGRLIRREDDRGLAIILDRRAAGFKTELVGLKRADAESIKMERLEGFFTRR